MGRRSVQLCILDAATGPLLVRADIMLARQQPIHPPMAHSIPAGVLGAAGRVGTIETDRVVRAGGVRPLLPTSAMWEPYFDDVWIVR